MKQSLQKLQKIFELEVERGYDNRAVVGGLDRILDSWEMEARADELPEDLIQAISIRLRDYPRLSESSRAEALMGLWRRLQREIGDSVPDLKFQKKQPTAQTEAQPVKPATPEAIPTEPEKTPAGEAPVSDEPAEEKPAPQDEESREEKTQAPEPEEPPAALNAPVTVLSKVGPKTAQTLNRLNLHVLGDMLYNLPRRYVDYSRLTPINRLNYGEEVTVIGTIQSVNLRPIRGGRAKIAEVVIKDGTGALRATWFNQPWIAKRMRVGSQVSISGKIDQYLGRLIMNNPEWEPLEQQQLSTNRIVPVYPLTAKITQRWLRRQMHQVVTYWAPRVPDHLPANIRLSAGLVDLPTALQQVHFPDSWDHLKTARYRLAFDEIFLLQLGVQQQKRTWQERDAHIFETSNSWLAAQVRGLPYRLTGSQQRALKDIRLDLRSGHPMNRLLQGDVGAGKTVVAALGVAMVTRHGAQAAIMAPTSILAEQHYQSMLRFLAREQMEDAIGNGGALKDHRALKPEEIRLMIGATPEPEKQKIREGLSNGSIKLIIGTHALIEDPVTFADLEMVIIDEQHRFGVEQRGLLRSKGTNPHLLVMTATPIPRSLALTVYGDLDLTVMDEMPPGRQAVNTFVLTPTERERAYSLICNQVEAGHQAFIIYPLVEESDKSESKAAVDEYTKLQSDVFPQFKLGLLHGRLKPGEKDDVMSRFHAGEYQVLVSTSVVEVGVDVPNATVMLIEGANRFGLAQLHQFRGRVGRAGDKAYCLLIPESSNGMENERLQAMAQTNDGFELADRDLEQRGPGQFLGTRQSGFNELQLASLTDVRLIEKARREALELFNKDPDLTQPEHQLLASRLERFWGGSKGDIS